MDVHESARRKRKVVGVRALLVRQSSREALEFFFSSSLAILSWSLAGWPMQIVKANLNSI